MKNILAALCLCAAPLLAQATEPSCPRGNADDYIVGGVDGEHSAMHWPTGLVWKRCTEGLSFDGGSQCSGAVAPAGWKWTKWNNEMGLLPKSFPARAQWGLTASGDHDLLKSGAWRLPYKNELVRFVQDCSTNGTLLATWSASPGTNKVPSGNWYRDAWAVNSSSAESWLADRDWMWKVRLVRGGQPFAALPAPARRSAPAGEAATFDAVTLLPSGPSGQAWGGARITGEGSPEFQINGEGPWRTQVIVRSDDRIAVRMTAGAAGTARTARLTVRSGKTADTASVPPGDNDEGGNEYTEMVETTADFILSAAINGACGSSHNKLTVLAPTDNLCSAGTAANPADTAAAFTWQCTGVNDGTTASCSAPRQYAVTATASPGTGGNAVTCSPNPATYNTTTTCTATPGTGYEFTQWEGACSGNGPCSPAVLGTISVTARFQRKTYPIAITPATGGTVACTPNPVEHGSTATCTATAQTGYTFASFGGACTGKATGASCSLANVTSAQTVSASFSLDTYPITTSAQPPEGGTVDCTPNPVGHGSGATCTATAQTGYTFTGFGGACAGTSCSLANVTSAQTVSASFSRNTYAITTSAQPPEGGTVDCTPNPVEHGSGATCTATAQTGYTFASFGGACAGASCSLANVTSAQNVSASFSLDTYAITASAEPAEAGRVVCAPNPVPHGGSATCQALSSAWRLAGWEDGCAGQGGPVCTLNNVTAAPTATARFDTHAPIPGPINDTGALACDASGPATRDCHHGRDAGAATGQLAKQGASSDARNGFDFTKISSSGAELQAGAADWACTRDNLTGLVWEVKTAASQDAAYTWHDPHSPDGAPGTPGTGTASFVESVNATGLCGATDWRVPTVQELAGLLDLGRATPAARIDPGYFPHTAAAGYWTRTPFAGDTSQAWQVDFASGAARPVPRSDALRVRLVRGGP